MKVLLKKLIRNILTRSGIAAVIVFALIFSVAAIKLCNSYSSIVTTFKNIDSKGIADSMKNFEKDYNNNFEPLQKAAVEIASQTEKAQGKRVYETTSMLLAFDSDDYLHRIMQKTEIHAKLSSLKKTMLYFQNKKIKSVFVMIPNSVVKDKTVLPQGIRDYQNEISDTTLSTLKEANLRTIDLRSEFAKNKIDPQKVFFNTDHHWTIQSNFQASKIVANYLNKSFKFNLDPKKVYSNLKNYSVKTYKKSFYGSYADTAGKAFVGDPEDFTTILPKYATNFRFKSFTTNGKLEVMYGKKMDITGPFSKSLSDGRHSYSTYFNMAKVEIVVSNLKSTSNKKCLVLGTSHARVASAFLCPYFRELRYADTQSNRFEKNLYKYVESYKPDVIIFMYPAFAYKNYRTFRYYIK
ncbi:MAG: hypothetical protein WC677_02270 [Clostridia bacterium]|jgi:hypothetical protein